MSISWGVIGATGIARRRTIPDVMQHARKSRIVAGCSPETEALRETQRELNLPRIYDTEAELLADPQVQAVYIASPVHLHLPHVRAAAAAGKHVLCEKPLGRDVPEAEQVVAACRAAGVLLGEALMMRFHACHQEAKRLIAEDRIGQPVMARAQLSCWYPRLEGAWRQIPAQGGGGSLMDMGCHCLDLLEHILDARIVEVTVMQDTLVQDYEVEDSSVALARFDNGALGIADNYFCIPDEAAESRLELYGSAGALLAKGTIGQAPGGSLELIASAAGGYDAQQERGASGREVLTPEPVPLYAAEVDHMSECIEKGLEPLLGAEEGLWSQRVMAACYESARSGRTVKP